MTTSEQEMRDAFEKWVSSPPFEYSVSRYPNDPMQYSWPGSYKYLTVELAWSAWKESSSRPVSQSSQPQAPG